MRISQPYGVRYTLDEFSQEPKKRYFIACEGEKTEYRYFKGIIDYRDEIGINPLVEIIPIRHDSNTSSNPLKIYEEAKEVLKSISNFLAGDKLCIIADRDKYSFSEKQYDLLLQAELEEKITLCISNPCFEFWLLLHYCNCSEYEPSLLLENTKDGNRTFVEKCLMEKLGGGYNKSRLHFQSNFKDRITIAIENSKKYSYSSQELKNTIGTKVGILIEEMLNKEE